MASDSMLAEVIAERDFARAECERLRFKLSMQQLSHSPASRMQQDQGHRGFERQPQPPSIYDRLDGAAATKLDTGKFCNANYL